MKIGQIGNRFQIPEIGYFSNQTLLEYDFLIVDPQIIMSQLQPTNFDRCRKRREAMEEFVYIKKVPIIYLSPLSISVDLIIRGHIQRVGINDILPVPAIITENEEGNDYAVTPKTALTDFLFVYKKWFGYRRYFTTHFGTTIAVTPYNNKILGFYTEDCVFLPELIWFDKPYETNFFRDLIDVVKKIRFQNELNPLPQWTTKYAMPGEQEVKLQIAKAKSEIERLTAELEKSNIDLGAITEKKKLFTAHGDELEFFVEIIFKGLGFEIIESDRGRDDLIAKYNGSPVVVEIKGLTNSAGEKNAAQLEKWRATYLEQNNIDPKGILIVNAYRDTPLVDRTEQAFPDQMLKYSKGREHCLITTVQLLSLYYEVKRNPHTRDAIVKSLFDTIGRYPDTYNWQNYITVNS